MSSTLVSSVCSSPPGSARPSRSCPGLLSETLVNPLETDSPIVGGGGTT